MKPEEYTEYIERLQEVQLECVKDYGIIFALSVSASQVRVAIYTTLSPAQNFFLYQHADKREGEKMMSRLDAFIRSVATWHEINLDRGNG